MQPEAIGDSNVTVCLRPRGIFRTLAFLARFELARYAQHNGNFVLVVSGSLKAESAKKVVEIVYDPLVKAIQLGTLVFLGVWSPPGRAEVSRQ